MERIKSVSKAIDNLKIGDKVRARTYSSLGCLSLGEGIFMGHEDGRVFGNYILGFDTEGKKLSRTSRITTFSGGEVDLWHPAYTTSLYSASVRIGSKPQIEPIVYRYILDNMDILQMSESNRQALSRLVRINNQEQLNPSQFLKLSSYNI